MGEKAENLEEKVEHSGDEKKDSEEKEKDTEEWQKFKLLTSGVDDILHKTKDDLDHIKETSYFQKKVDKNNDTEGEGTSDVKKEKWVTNFDLPDVEDEPEPVEVEEPEKAEEPEEPVDEEEEEEEDDNIGIDDEIFDTAYADALIGGEIKLAYIPDSPTEDPT